MLQLAIEDNGIRFDPTGVVKLGHQGLANMRERAAAIGGTVTIDSRPGIRDAVGRPGPSSRHVRRARV